MLEYLSILYLFSDKIFQVHKYNLVWLTAGITGVRQRDRVYALLSL